MFYKADGGSTDYLDIPSTNLSLKQWLDNQRYNIRDDKDDSRRARLDALFPNWKIAGRQVKDEAAWNAKFDELTVFVNKSKGKDVSIVV